MTLKDMEYIVTIAQEKGITKAANRLYVAQPALSQCVQKVEKELGTAIFVRSSSGVQPTSEGECFLFFAEKVLQEQGDFKKRMQDVENADLGKIRLGFSGTQAAYVLPHILPSYKQKHPSVQITLIEATSDEIEQKLLQQEVDVGILHLPILADGLDYFELSRDSMVVIPRSTSQYQPYVYYKEGNPRPYIDMKFLMFEPLILTSPGQRSRMVCDRIFANAGIVPHIKETSRSLSTLDALTQVDYASTIMPEKQVSPALRSRGCYYLEENLSVPFSFVMATLKNSYLSIAVQSLKKELMEKHYTF